MTTLSRALSEVLPWVLMAVLVFNMTQRRFMNVGMRKRYATLWMAGLIAGAWGATITFKRFDVPDVFLVAVAAALAVVAWLQRRSILVYALTCDRCHAPLSIKRVLYYDEPRCDSCQGEPPAASM